MKKIIKFIKKNMLVILVFISIVLNVVVLANTTITSNEVSYQNNKTNETTVEGSLDELFSAVNINERLGNANISNIGNGTITGAISTLNKNVNNINTNISTLNGLTSNIQTQLDNQNNVITYKTHTISSYQSEINYHVSSCKSVNGICIFTADFAIPSGEVLYGDGRAYLAGFPVPWTVNGLPEIFTCIYRNTASGATLIGHCSINNSGQLTLSSSLNDPPFETNQYTRSYNEVRVSGVYGCK